MRWAVVLAVVVVAACGSKTDESVVTITRPSEQVPFDRTFAWQPVSAATEYHVAVFTSEGSRAFEVRDLKTAGVKLADGLQLPAGKYSVQVTALRDGRTVAESRKTEFDIR